MEELIEKAKNGDKDAFGNIMLSLEKDLYRIAKLRLKNNDDIYDAVQETILIAFKSIKKLKIDYQNAIYLADFEKLSYKEIGEILQKNNSQVKILVYRARRALEKIVRKEELKYEEW